MKKTAEIVTITLMLGALYLSSPLANFNRQSQNAAISNNTAGEVLLIADGTDPMPGKKR